MRAFQTFRALFACGCLSVLLFTPGICLTTARAAVIQSGETLDGQIAPAGDTDTWTFDAVAGDSYVIRAGENVVVGDLRPKIQLTGPGGVNLGSAQGFEDAEFAGRATNSGTFTIVVSSALANGAGTYRISLFKATGVPVVSSGDEGGAILSGETKTGGLSLGDLDVWTFDAVAGDNIVAKVGEVTVNGDLRPRIRLYGPTGLLLDDAQGFEDAEVAFRATNSGPYRVVVNAALAGGSGSYRVALFKTPDVVTVSPGDEGGPILNGEMKTGSLPLGDLDVWTVEANAGDSLIAKVGEVTLIGDLRPLIRIYGPTGILLDSAQGFDDAEVSTRATNSGPFTIVVSASLAGGAGTYRLSVARTAGEITVSGGDESGEIRNGETLEATLPLGDLDVWTFNASVGDSIIAKVGEFVVASDIRPLLRLYGPTGALLDFSQGFDDAEVGVRATNSGPFTLVVSASLAAGAGSYRLALAKSPGEIFTSANDEGGTIRNGETVEASLHLGDLDIWTFDASVGDSIIAKVGELVNVKDVRPLLRLYGPTGILLDSAQGFDDAEVSTRATNSGPFTIVVSASLASGTGTYRLALVDAPAGLIVTPGDEGGALANGETREATLHVGDLDPWKLSAKAGDNIVVRVGELPSLNDVRPSVRLFGPTGILVASGVGFDAIEVATRATNSGRFTIVVSAGLAGGSGPYRVQGISIAGDYVIGSEDEGGLVVAGAELGGSIQNADLDPWVFTGCAGEILTIQADALPGGTGFLPKLRLYGRDGALLDTKSAGNSARISLKAPSSGTYTVLVSDASGSGNLGGRYRLDVLGLYAGVKLCVPVRSGEQFNFNGAGGLPGTEYVVTTSTNIIAPRELWLPILTNRFGTYGEVNFTQPYDPGVIGQYFRLSLP